MQKRVPEPDPSVADVERLITEGLGPLRHTWTDVKGLRMHSLAPTDKFIGCAGNSSGAWLRAVRPLHDTDRTVDR